MWSKRYHVWQVTVGGKYVGQSKNEIEAAGLYDKYAVKKYGEFARLNFPNNCIPTFLNTVSPHQSPCSVGVATLMKSL